MKIIWTLSMVASVASLALADLGIMDTNSEITAKNEAASIGITQIYDHPNQSTNGQFVVPVQYNRTSAEGNGAEFDPNNSKKNDIDYVPLAQLKGAAGAAGQAGAVGTTGATGQKGDKGNSGANGKDGRDGTDASIDNHLFLNIGLNVRWYDWKHVSLNSGYRYDVRHFNHTVDIAVVHIKLGRSHEQREIDKLKKLLGFR